MRNQSFLRFDCERIMNFYRLRQVVSHRLQDLNGQVKSIISKLQLKYWASKQYFLERLTFYIIQISSHPESISELLSKWWKQCDLTQHGNVVMKRNNCYCSPESNEINPETFTMVFAKVTITDQIRDYRFFQCWWDLLWFV